MRARHALAQADLRNDVPLERASSATNEVWLTDALAVRVNRVPSGRLRREALIARTLPAGSGYPEVVAHGGETGADWLITKRAPGEPLGHLWAGLHVADRRWAVRQLAACLRVIHSCTPPPDLGEAPSPQLVSSYTFSPVVPLLLAVEELRRLKFIDRLLLERTSELIGETGDVLAPFDKEHLVHGDLHFENVIWDGEKVTAVLDLEYARPSPPDLDLDVLLRCCAHPELHVAPQFEADTNPRDFDAVPGWFAADYPELFSHPRLLDRVRLYAIGFELKDLRIHPPPGASADLPTAHPQRRLQRLVDGESYVDRLLTPLV